VKEWLLHLSMLLPVKYDIFKRLTIDGEVEDGSISGEVFPKSMHMTNPAKGPAGLSLEYFRLLPSRGR
jgi:hypothetical protein